jgi:hypothetical protein
MYNLGLVAVLDAVLLECAQLATQNARAMASQARNALHIDATELLILFPLILRWSRNDSYRVRRTRACALHALPAGLDVRRFALSV